MCIRDVNTNLELLLCQYYEHVEEAEWAIEVCKETGKPTACSLCIGPEGDLHGVSPGDCAVRLAKAGTFKGKHEYQVMAKHIIIIRYCLAN